MPPFCAFRHGSNSRDETPLLRHAALACVRGLLDLAQRNLLDRPGPRADRPSVLRTNIATVLGVGSLGNRSRDSSLGTRPEHEGHGGRNDARLADAHPRIIARAAHNDARCPTTSRPPW